MNKKNLTLKPLLYERLQKLLSDKKDFQDYLDILKVEPDRSIRCNTLKISSEKLKKKLEEKGWKIKQPWKNYPEVMIVEGKFAEASASDIGSSQSTLSDCSLKKITNSKNFSYNNSLVLSASDSEHNLIDLEPGELGSCLEHLLGYYYIQEIASMLPIIVLNPQKDETVLDLCSAPGSKTTQIASEMENTGTIIANEVSAGRIKILASNSERCGVTNIIITKKDGFVLCKKLKEQKFQADKILVDAPCSGEGTLRSSPKTYVMWNIKSVKNLSKIQKNLASTAFEILKPEGIMIYSTCTHAPEENEEVVNFLLEKFGKEIEILEVKLPFKAREGIVSWEDKNFDKRIKLCARVYPHDNNTEGFFISKFKKLK